MTSPIEEVTQELLTEAPTASIARDRVFQWMQSEDIEVLGAVFSLLHKEEHFTRISPPLSFTDYRAFHLRYYERCIVEDPSGDWSDSRYLAAHSLVGWFKGLWDDANTPRDALREIKQLLARLYRGGNAEVRTCVVTGALEHLLPDARIRRFFADWREDATLAAAYVDAWRPEDK